MSTISFLAYNKLLEFHKKLDEIQSNPSAYSEIETSEAYETLGKAQYYNGYYSKAFGNLEQAISGNYQSLRPDKSVATIKLLV